MTDPENIKVPIKPELCARKYPTALAKAREAAFPLGYTVAVHGSQARDLDLIAVPWVEQAVSAEELILAIEQAVEGFIARHGRSGLSSVRLKPHGRKAWCIQLGGGPYLDVSVLPRAQDLQPQ